MASYQNNARDEQERWGRSKDSGSAVGSATGSEALYLEHDILESNGGFLPPNLADGPSLYASLPGIGSPNRRDGGAGHARVRTQSDLKEGMEGVLKAKNWKSRWLVLKDGRVIMGKDRLVSVANCIRRP